MFNLIVCYHLLVISGIAHNYLIIFNDIYVLFIDILVHTSNTFILSIYTPTHYSWVTRSAEEAVWFIPKKYPKPQFHHLLDITLRFHAMQSSSKYNIFSEFPLRLQPYKRDIYPW